MRDGQRKGINMTDTPKADRVRKFSATDKFRSGWDRVFGKRKTKEGENPEPKPRVKKDK